MQNDVKRQIFLVDDEPEVLKVLSTALKDLTSGVSLNCFTSPPESLEKLTQTGCDLFITDLDMPEMDGIDLLKTVKKMNPRIPVLVITGYADVPLAVKAIKAGASEFLEKPLETESFRTIVKKYLNRSVSAHPLAKLPLSQAEQKVLKLVLKGYSSKEIANHLYRSIRTIEDHRSHIMHKLEAHNLVELIKRAIKMGLFDPEE